MSWNTPKNNWAPGDILTSTKVNELANNERYLKGQDGTIAFESGATFAGNVTASSSTVSGASASFSGTMTANAIAVTSTAVVTNLNADNVDGYTWLTPVYDQSATGTTTLGTGPTPTATTVDFTTTRAGYWLVTATIALNVHSSDTGINIYLGIRDGSGFVGRSTLVNIPAAGQYVFTVTNVLSLANGIQTIVGGYKASGAGTTYIADGYSSIQGCWLAP